MPLPHRPAATAFSPLPFLPLLPSSLFPSLIASTSLLSSNIPDGDTEALVSPAGLGLQPSSLVSLCLLPHLSTPLSCPYSQSHVLDVNPSICTRGSGSTACPCGVEYTEFSHLHLSPFCQDPHVFPFPSCAPNQTCAAPTH